MFLYACIHLLGFMFKGALRRHSFPQNSSLSCTWYEWLSFRNILCSSYIVSPRCSHLLYEVKGPHVWYPQGWVHKVEGLFWHVRCNRKLKNKTSITLNGYSETLTPWILRWVKNKKCRKLNGLSKYIFFLNWKCC